MDIIRNKHHFKLPFNRKLKQEIKHFRVIMQHIFAKIEQRKHFNNLTGNFYSYSF